MATTTTPIRSSLFRDYGTPTQTVVDLQNALGAVQQSQTAAAASASAASSSATSAAASASTAASSASTAVASVTAVVNSGTATVNSLVSSATTSINNSTSAAATSASNAATSEANAAASASSAATSASGAATSATNASASESAALAYASSAAKYYSQANTSATNAFSYANQAQTAANSISLPSPGPSNQGQYLAVQSLGAGWVTRSLANVWSDISQPGTSTPGYIGDTGGVGTSSRYARADHTHGMAPLTSLTLSPRVAPSAPGIGFILYVDTADNKLKAISSTGTITTLANP